MKTRATPTTATAALIVITMTAMRSFGAGLPDKVDYNRDIRPILSNNCFLCHGPDEAHRKAKLRLDTRDGALKDLDGYSAVVPGKPDISELVIRILDSDDPMPPTKSGKKLTDREIGLLKKWVEQGAGYAKHWSYAKPQRPAPPQTKNKRWSRNAIDAFILARLEREGLVPQERADRYTLIRRASLHLTGLPPTLEEVEAFINDKSENAYEKVIDRLLASSAYGEHWAALWLDLARYADSAGYANDPPRTIWMYRNWVIKAINNNMPFDQFTIEQLAGDLLPNPTQDQLIATAFHRNTVTNSEGGTNDEEFRTVAVNDRVSTTMQVWMGTTIECAQCHNHKYDPISQEEYYQLFAILNNTEDADRANEAPTLMSLSDQQKQQRAAIEAKIAALQKLIADEAKKPKGPNATGVKIPKRTGKIPVRYLRVQAIGKQMFLHLAEVEAFVGSDNVAVKGKATQSTTAYNGPAKLANDGKRDGNYENKSVSHTAQEDNPWIEIDLGKAVHLDKVMVWNRTDGDVGSRLKQFRLIAMNANREPVWVRQVNQTPKPSVQVVLPASFEAFTAKDTTDLAAHLTGSLATNKAASPLQKQVAALQKQLNGIKGIPTPIMRELTGNRRRKTHILMRGNFLDKGKQVTEGTPQTFHAFPDDQPKNRLGLARWLVSEDNPLTARVIVNRYWEEMFGAGIVRTSEEFGNQGELPTHPELLDWLATELIRLKWDTKALLKTIVMSSAYQQSSRVTPQALAKDPANRLLSRGPRFRLSAEVIRDQALAVSGLLSRKMYGPSVKPPRPKLGLRAAFGGSTDWNTSGGEDKYRRGLYTTWRRSLAYPSMATFTAPSRNVCTIRRIRTNTPLQALVTLNDPVYVEASQALARRMMAEGGKSIDQIAAYGFRLCLSRPPNAEEVKRIRSLFERARAKFAQEEQAAKDLATVPIGAAPQGVNITDLAAWTLVANVYLNLDETLMNR